MINKGKMRKKRTSTVYFADIAIESLELRKRFQRSLEGC